MCYKNKTKAGNAVPVLKCFDSKVAEFDSRRLGKDEESKPFSITMEMTEAKEMYFSNDNEE